MSEIDRHGVEKMMPRRSSSWAELFLHVSLDLDAVDPMFAPGVGTPVRGGLSYREAHLALELVPRRACSTRSTWSRSIRSRS